MKFTFSAKTPQGAVKHGTIDARDRAAAVQLLQRNNLVLLKLEEEGQKKDTLQSLERLFESVKPKEMMVFFRQLSTLVASKVPIVTSLRTIQAQTENRRLRTIVKELAADVEDGMPLSESMEQHLDVFSPLAINMIKSGEVSGNLQGSIDYVTRNIEQNYQLTQKVRGALTYPVFVITVAIIIGFLTITFILPRLTQVIKDLEAEVPWYTTAMINLGDFMQAYWWIALIIIATAVGSIIYYIRTPSGRKEWDQFKLKIPVVGDMFRYVYITRFSENLAVLLAGGIPMVQALVVVADIVNNDTYRKMILRSAQEVKDGGEIGAVMAKAELMPPMVTNMIRIGEETGKLGDILNRLAEFYRQEVEQMTKTLSTVIEPILIVVLGIGVGILVVSVLMPIYNIAGQI